MLFSGCSGCAAEGKGRVSSGAARTRTRGRRRGGTHAARAERKAEALARTVQVDDLGHEGVAAEIKRRVRRCWRRGRRRPTAATTLRTPAATVRRGERHVRVYRMGDAERHRQKAAGCVVVEEEEEGEGPVSMTRRRGVSDGPGAFW